MDKCTSFLVYNHITLEIPVFRTVVNHSEENQQSSLAAQNSINQTSGHVRTFLKFCIFTTIIHFLKIIWHSPINLHFEVPRLSTIICIFLTHLRIDIPWTCGL